jgi:hypothetical protein
MELVSIRHADFFINCKEKHDRSVGRDRAAVRK